MTPERERILRHVRRYRVTTIDAVHARLSNGQKGRDATRKALARLCDSGHLERTEIRNRSFYWLTQKGATLVCAPRRSVGPPGVQALIERYAVLCFCTLRSQERERLLPTELRDAFPELLDAPQIDPAVQHYYFTQDNGVPSLGRAVVDCGAEVTTLIDKCQTFARHASSTMLGELVEQGLFSLTLLTPYPQKAAKVLAALEEVTPPRGRAALYRVEVVPEMTQLGQ